MSETLDNVQAKALEIMESKGFKERGVYEKAVNKDEKKVLMSSLLFEFFEASLSTNGDGQGFYLYIG